MNFQNAVDKSTILSPYRVPGTVQNALWPSSCLIFHGAFKTGFIILFLQIAKLRHSFKNVQEYTQHIVGRTGIQSRSVWPRRVCCLLAEYTLWSVHSHSLPSLLRVPVAGVSLSTLEDCARSCDFLWPMEHEGCRVCAAALKTRVWFGSASHVLLFSAMRKRETNHVEWNRPTHRIDPQSLGSPLVMWTRSECLYSKIQRFLGLLITAAKAD